jgi:protein ImuB
VNPTATRPARVACVDVPALSLQLVLREHPEWVEDPVVVVEDDRPQAGILWANRPARAVKITRGLSFSQARALSSKLHAAILDEPAIEAAIDEIFELLVDFTPHVEPVLLQPGLFWLDPSGLEGLFGSLLRWAEQIHARLADAHLVSAVVVGFRRAGAFALARTTTGALVLEDLTQEQARSERVPLSRLGVSPALVREMELLGVRTVGELLSLPAGELRKRYGAEVARLHDFLAGRSWTPLLPRTPGEPLTLELEVDPPDDDHTRLLFGLKGALHRVVERLAAEQHAITGIELELMLERLGTHREQLETAAPTLDVVQIVDLLRLRLSNVALPARVEQIRATLQHLRVHPRQLEMARGERRRDLEAAARALARIRASFGPRAVVRAQLHEAHLPEGRFRYEPASEVQLPRASRMRAPSKELPLVRRVFSAPRPLPPMPSHEPESWLGRHGATLAMYGPDRIAGGWWARMRERDYYYVETRTGEILWIYYDRPARRFRLHGIVS